LKNRNIRGGAAIRETAIFAMLGAIMFCSKMVMDLLPNIHLIGALTMVYTLVYRKKALYPIYIFVLITGLYGGFALWWIPYLYVWAILWGVTMLLPKDLPDKYAAVIYPLVCGAHGLLYGILYAPAQALMFGLDFEGMVAWIVAGFPFDLLHAGGNLVAGLLILPLSKLLRRLEGQAA
jgi:energy-coupling factor transport system substrate-specific component